MKRTTIKNVARHAGVSTATVSRVFSKEPSVSVDIASRVRASAELLDYRPSMMARSLTGSQTNLVALVVGRLHNPFDAELVESLSEQLHANGQRLLVVPADYGENNPAAMVALDYQVDGVIVAAGHLSASSAERFVQLGVPVIVYGRTLDVPGVDCVIADNITSSRMVGQQFRRHDVKRTLFVRHVRETFSDDERECGLREGLGESVNLDILRCTKATARECMLNVLAGSTPPQAVYCANDVLAFGVIEAAVQLGFHIPEDVMVVGFDDVDMAASPFFSLTTLRQVPEDIARWIVLRLAERLENQALKVVVHRLPAQLVLRNSTPDSIRIGGSAVQKISRKDIL
jgi:DNA-binding LacI/PurR family transcriptional regulator